MLEVFEAHRAQLTVKAYQVTRSWFDAEDVVQGVWIRWAAHSRDVTAPTSWLYRVTANSAIDHLRRAEHPGQVSLLDVNAVSSQQTEPDNVVEVRDEVRGVVKILLESLSPLERAVFILRRVGRCSHTETALVLGRTPAAVRQLDHRASTHFANKTARFVVADPVVRRVTRRLFLAAAAGELEWMVNVVAPELPVTGFHPHRSSSDLAS